MPNLMTKIALFLSSYLPLALIIYAQLFNNHPFSACIIIGLAFFGYILLQFYIWQATHLNPVTLKVTSTSNDNEAIMSYIVTYLLPFMVQSYSDITTNIGMGIFFFMMAILYTQSDLIHVNPMLALSGYRIYSVETSDGEVFSIISKRRPIRGHSLTGFKIGDRVVLASMDTLASTTKSESDL